MMTYGYWALPCPCHTFPRGTDRQGQFLRGRDFPPSSSAWPDFPELTLCRGQPVTWKHFRPCGGAT